MKKIFLILLMPFAAFSDTCHLEQVGGGDWRIVCTGSGLVYNYVDITNDIYVVQDCEQLKQSLLSSASQLSQTISENIPPDLSYIRASASYIIDNSAEATTIDQANEIVRISNSILQKLDPIQANLTDTSFPDGIAYSINNINCGSCPTNGLSGGGSGGSCCDVDFTEIIDRLIEAEHQRVAITNQIASISYYLGVVTNELAYNNFLLEHGFGDITNQIEHVDFLLNNIYTNLVQYPIINYSIGSRRALVLDHSGTRGQLTNSQSTYTPSKVGYLNSFSYALYGIQNATYSLNNYLNFFRYQDFPNLTNTVSSFHQDTTNYFSFFRGEIGVRGVLEDWTNEEADGTYYDFLTNHYINVVRGGSLSGYTAEKTNWFARIETLLASLVFLDDSNTNAYDSAAGSVSNSINRVKDDFESTLDGVSNASSSQIELAHDIEKSMYESLQNFSKAFSSASLPSSVRVIYVYKGGGPSRSSFSDTVDVSVDIEGKLKDFIEIIRSCSTLCWVFFGLWFMFKFSVWTVKKIYVLIRYIIDFFNMIAGGK